MNAPKTAVAAALALTLVAMPLAACDGQASQGGEGEPTGTEQTQASNMDISSWKTLGDALAFDTEDRSAASWDEEHYVTVFDTADGSVVRVVAKMNTDTYNKHAELDTTDDDYDEQFLKVMGGLELESAEDITDQKISQTELDAYVGKTGQDLANDGFKFQNYWMYGGDETGASMAKGFFDYNVTFDVTVTEDESESDETGAAVMGATIVSMEYSGASNAAVDPEGV